VIQDARSPRPQIAPFFGVGQGNVIFDGPAQARTSTGAITGRSGEPLTSSQFTVENCALQPPRCPTTARPAPRGRHPPSPGRVHVARNYKAFQPELTRSHHALGLDRAGIAGLIGYWLSRLGSTGRIRRPGCLRPRRTARRARRRQNLCTLIRNAVAERVVAHPI